MEARRNFAPASGGVSFGGQRQRYRHEWNLPGLCIMDIVKGQIFVSAEVVGTRALSSGRGETGYLCGLKVPSRRKDEIF